MKTNKLDTGETLVTYSEWGDSQGTPVLYLHGSPGSRMERPVGTETLKTMGVRLITFDRPGYGNNPPSKEPAFHAVVEYARLIADELRLDHFCLLAFSGGGAYAFAIAADLGDRISAIATLGCLGPLDRPGAFAGMFPPSVAELRTAVHGVDELERLMKDQRNMPSFPDFEVQTLLDNPDILSHFLEGSEASTSQGAAGLIADLILLSRPWNINVCNINCPITLFHGVRDTLVPFHHAQHLAEILQTSHLALVPRAGHFGILNETETALRILSRYVLDII